MSVRSESRRLRRKLVREWLVALSAYALLVAPFGCQLQTGLTGGDGELSSDSVGLFINSDTSSKLILAGRGAGGDEFFVYGTRNADGTLDQVSSFLVRTTAGETSSVIFDDGWPVYAKGPDGSYIAITYDELTSQRLVGTVTVYDAARDVTESYDIDIDLDRTAAQVADAIEEVTGQKVTLPSAGKLLNNAQAITLTSPIYIVFITPVVFMVNLCVVVMGQVMTAVFSTVAVAMQSAILAALTPVFLISGLLDQLLLQAEYAPLIEVFVELPEPPQIEVNVS